MKVPSYSIAKTLTAAAFIQTGVNLDGTVGDYLQLDDHYKKRNIKSLLQHTSGLPDYPALPEYSVSVEDRMPAWHAAEMLERTKLLAEVSPAKFSYSNIGYTLLRLVLEEITGQDFFSALNTNVFTPLEIEGVSPLAKIEDWQNCEEASESIRNYDPAWVYPGMVLATPLALSMCFEGIFSGKLFDPRVLMQTVKVDVVGHTFLEPRYGLGTMSDGARWVGHGGGGPGFSLFALCYPDGRAATVSYTTEPIASDAVLIEECIRKLQGR